MLVIDFPQTEFSDSSIFGANFADMNLGVQDTSPTD